MGEGREGAQTLRREGPLTRLGLVCGDPVAIMVGLGQPGRRRAKAQGRGSLVPGLRLGLFRQGGAVPGAQRLGQAEGCLGMAPQGRPPEPVEPGGLAAVALPAFHEHQALLELGLPPPQSRGPVQIPPRQGGVVRPPGPLQPQDLRPV